MDLEIAFRLRGCDGIVRVNLTVNDQPERWQGPDQLARRNVPGLAHGHATLAI
jgi:hypothetical protein